MSASKDTAERLLGLILLNMLDTDSGEPPQLRCTCISPAYQPLGSGTDCANTPNAIRIDKYQPNHEWEEFERFHADAAPYL